MDTCQGSAQGGVGKTMKAQEKQEGKRKVSVGKGSP